MGGEWLRELLESARPWSGVITVFGALLVFLSWTLNNTLRERYSKLKTAIEAAQSEIGTTSDLAEIKEMICNLNYEMMELMPESPGERAKPEAEYTANDMYRNASDYAEYVWRGLHEMRRITRLAEQNAKLSKSAQSKSESQRELEAFAKDLVEMSAKIEENRYRIERTARDSSYGKDEAMAKEAFQLRKELHKYLTDNVWFVVKDKRKRLGELVKQRGAEVERRLARAKRGATWFGRWHVLLYMVGGSLALFFGQYVEKAMNWQGRCDTLRP